MARLKNILIITILLASPNTDVLQAQAPSSPELLLVVDHGRAGYIDNTGTRVIPPQFVDARDFSEDLAAAYVTTPDSLYPLAGYIDKRGTWAIKPQFDWAGPFREGFARVKLNDLFGSHALVRRDGQVIPLPHGDYNGMVIGDFSEGLAVYSPGIRFGYIDSSGRIAITPRFDDANAFRSGLALVKIGDRYEFINKEGKVAIPQQYAAATDFHGESALVCLEKKSNCGSIDKNGTFKPTPRPLLFSRWDSGWYSDEDLDFAAEGLYEIEGNGGYGYADANGKVVIPPKYRGVHRFSEGLAAVTIDEYGSCGYIDKADNFVIPALFSSCDNFKNGHARVAMLDRYVGNRMAYIDKTGKPFWLSNTEGLLLTVPLGRKR